MSLKAALERIPKDQREKALKITHDLYAEFHEQWELLLDAMDGCGGFLTGGYLWKFPREKKDKFEERQAQARYHNYVESLVEIYVRHLFGRGVTRDTNSDALKAFWLDVDGHGTALTDYLKTQTALALATGHIGILMDKPPVLPPGPSKADEQAAKSLPFLTSFTPVAILDWRLDHDELVAVKLSECVESDDLLDEGDADAKQYLLWDLNGWLRSNFDGSEITAGEDIKLGLVPFHVVRAKRGRRYPFLGKSLVNASLVRALYNRASEEDDVLRNQAFSVFTVSLPNGATPTDVQATKDQLGGDIGTTSALVVIGEGDYKTPDMEVPKTIRENQQWLIQEIYRMAHLRFNRDSLEAETAESIRLQHAELNEMLVGLAGELAECEKQLARFYFYWTEASPEAAERAFEAAQVTIKYPEEFFLREIGDELKDWAQAIQMGLGETFTKLLKKRAVKRIDPNLDPKTLETVEKEIDALKDDPMASMADQIRQNTGKRFPAPVKGAA